ncbi:ABC transporter permease [Clostridium sp. Marseille-Q7071]
MFQNNNQKIVNKIAMRSFKANRLRNIFTILAIILTTVLITSVFTMGISLMESFKQSELRMYGHYAHGNFKLLTTEQYEKIKKHPLVKEYGMGIMVSNADNNVFMKKPCEIWYLDKNNAKYRFSTPTIGKLPEKENEIAMETWVLDMLEVPHKLGSTVNLEYKIKGKQYKKEFELSGFWEGNKNLAIAGTAIVSMDFINKNLSHINQMESIKNNDYTGLISMGVMFDSEVGIDNKMNQIVTDMGYEAKRGYPPKYINYGEHPAYYSRNLTDITVLLPYMAIILLVMFSGYLLIYNIFYISVVRDTRFYGLLKTVGTTSKQLKKIITKQGLLLSVIGIPLGIIIGYFTGGIATRLSTKTLILECYVISKNPSIFIGSAIFSLITVLISCRKPRKVASKISPIEAVKYTGVINSSKKIVKNNSKGVKLHKMAFLNIFRNKKKVFIVLISLSLSMVVFNFFYSLIAGYNVEKSL